MIKSVGKVNHLQEVFMYSLQVYNTFPVEKDRHFIVETSNAISIHISILS